MHPHKQIDTLLKDRKRRYSESDETTESEEDDQVTTLPYCVKPFPLLITLPHAIMQVKKRGRRGRKRIRKRARTSLDEEAPQIRYQQPLLMRPPTPMPASLVVSAPYQHTVPTGMVATIHHDQQQQQ